MKLTFDVPEELVEKIGEEIKAALEEYKKKQTWPQEGDEYYYITGAGNILVDCYDDHATDIARLDLGNCFKTLEEAEFKVEQLKVLYELKELADDDQPWDGNHHHYVIYYLYSSDSISAEHWHSQQYLPNAYYFQSYESAQNAVAKIGKERLQKYYLCIPKE